ncbi:unnamed protein product [Larinioides sclopetarius]|uniref:Uncharacterized protein n=1 Tax=Larinioides sclopetarius TaxID=280406 RepID=A0AAV2AD46_9ARAC
MTVDKNSPDCLALYPCKSKGGFEGSSG